MGFYSGESQGGHANIKVKSLNRYRYEAALSAFGKGSRLLWPSYFDCYEIINYS